MGSVNRETSASDIGGASQDTKSQTTGADPIAQLSGRDLIDKMHTKARRGCRLDTMCHCFWMVNPKHLEEWYRTNGYMNARGFSNGESDK